MPKHPATPTAATCAPAPAPAPAPNPAQTQAALHRAALLLARCRQLHLPPATPQARWQAQQQYRFLAWLDAGGFAQSEPAKENSGTGPLLSAPQKGLNEEFKFSLLRIDDAVE